ncbi:DUF4192 domain-containing protein [Rhodococcus qingshengii]|uniref:DUF4192 domain-containing protein n=1 Tax=Rhodococcus qingshengii TaxID=334542 RepID=UPI0022B3928E|nr:DUF4192 domain-containing protein [Rhodococcus qingshengii]MCZ4618444.1 DUF4192 domain-containing protein [Rhodococcus qingshengii]
MQNIRLTTATDVLAAVPAILGFVPTDSVVMVSLIERGGEPTTLGFVARTDAAAAAPIYAYRQAIAQAAVTAVIWVVVGTGGVAAAGLDQIDESRRELDTMGIRTVRTLVAQSLEFGAEWFDLDGHESGLTTDPNLSDTSLAHALEGRQTVSSRDEIAARFTEGEAADMDAAHATAREQGEDFVRLTITEFAAALRGRKTPSLELVARIGVCATMRARYRDALIGVIAISAPAAQDAFTAAAAHLRGNERLQVLTLAGLAAYVAHNGPVAGIAFQTAHGINDHAAHTGLLDLLDKSLEMGVPPSDIAELVATGIEVAQSLGIDIETGTDYTTQ